MATKTKTAAAPEGIETAMKNGADAMKKNFEKAAKGYDKLVSFGKESAEAWVKSANAATKGIEALNGELYAYSRQSIEGSLAATKAMLASKSVHEVFEIQTDFAKTAIDAYLGQMTKVGDIVTSTAKDATAPLQSRFTAFVESVEKARAA